MRDGGRPVFELLVDVEQLSRLALARAEVAIVEDQAGVAGLAEALGVGVESHLAHGAETVAHDHDGGRRGHARRGLGQVEPRRAARVARWKVHVDPVLRRRVGHAEVLASFGAADEVDGRGFKEDL